MDEAAARALVEDVIAGFGGDSDDSWTPVVTRLDRFERGWIVYYGAAESDVTLAGNAPYLVDELSGDVVGTGSAEPVAHYVDNYLRTGDPHAS
ncbi:MAG TPA: hypothetical protein VGR11_08295 [Solirubrobacteraceae bacterium]|nr:hypothetical protein [Solirubrobacteraceae bacterium]